MRELKKIFNRQNIFSLIKCLFFSVAGKNLSISQEDAELNLIALTDFTVPCQIARQSSVGSEFQVTWFFQKDTEHSQELIFRAGRNSTQQFRKSDELRFCRPSSKHFTLTLLSVNVENSGLYFCEVEEWVPSLTHGWRYVTVERSGNYNVTVHAKGKHWILFPVNISSHRVQSCTYAQF